MTRRLSTCAVCAGTIERRPTAVAGWGHVTETSRTADGHLPEPDDSAVSGPDRCEWCDGIEGEHDDECGSPEVEAERALDDDADAYLDRCRD